MFVILMSVEFSIRFPKKCLYTKKLVNNIEKKINKYSDVNHATFNI